jgi:cytochrome c biogenesis protein CcmG/thiol:disulfide interchange protein DsbE
MLIERRIERGVVDKMDRNSSLSNTIFMVMIVISATGYARDNPAADFTLPDLDGDDYRLAQNIGQGPVLINFWATWCIPCRAEMKQLKKLYKKYREKGLQIVSISIDDPKTVSRVKGTVKSNRYPFTVLLDTNGEVFKLYQGLNPPLSILIDKKGQIVSSFTGYRKGDEVKLEKEILSLLRQ